MSAELDIFTLAAAAAEARKDQAGWDEDTVTGALIATQHADPPWPTARVWRELAREIGDPDGHPRNLVEAARVVLDGPREDGERSSVAAGALAAMKATAEQAAEAARARKQAGVT